MNVWFENDVKNILSAVVVARSPLTDDDKKIIEAIAAGFGFDVRFDGNARLMIHKEPPAWGR